MAEEVKKAPPPDPNSAKYKLGKIIEDHFREANEAKARGEKVGWSSSIFPQEIYQTLGLHVCYPENQAAAIGARKAGEKYCGVAEGVGYSCDICAYARINTAFSMIGVSEEQPMPPPDFILCCNNICNCMTKWYENLGKTLGIPVIYIDVPMSPTKDISWAEVEYVKGQFMHAVRQLEEIKIPAAERRGIFFLPEKLHSGAHTLIPPQSGGVCTPSARITGKRWDEEKFRHVMAISNCSSRAWIKAANFSACKPSPFNGFDLMNHMAVIVCARGTEAAVDAFETLAREYEQNVKEGKSTFRGEEKHRIMWEGIACWPWLKVTGSTLKDKDINMVATVYAQTFGVFYDDFDGLCRGYCNVVNCQCLEAPRDSREKIIRDNGCDGLLIHNNRSCKPWSVFMPEMGRQIARNCGIPVVSFDGDQADPRNFSEAQYVTRVQGLKELMETNRGVNNGSRRDSQNLSRRGPEPEGSVCEIPQGRKKGGGGDPLLRAEGNHPLHGIPSLRRVGRRRAVERRPTLFRSFLLRHRAEYPGTGHQGHGRPGSAAPLRHPARFGGKLEICG